MADTTREPVVEHENGNGNARIARLEERLTSAERRLGSNERSIDGIKGDTAKRNSWLTLMAPAGLMLGGLVALYQWALAPIKVDLSNTKALIEAETKERMEEDAQIRNGFKFGLDFVADTEREVLDERDLRYTNDIKQLKRRVDKLEERL